MFFPYPERFIPNAMCNLGEMYGYAVHTLKYDIDEFQKIFLESGVAAKFEVGNIEVIVGMSGYELAYYVLWETELPSTNLPLTPISHSTRSYFAGSSVAQLQRLSGRTFENIHSYLPMSKIENMAVACQNLDDTEVFNKLYDELIKVQYKNDKNFLELSKD